MKAFNRKDIKALLNKALATQTNIICTLRNGLTETEHIHSEDPVLYTTIVFQPQKYLFGDYIGLMFYPDGKSQGQMDFDSSSFESVEWPVPPVSE